ncbi:MAG: hypothetical protein CM15mP102_09580 [Flavobacteriales bacterium]|nr:MAG: hypothetical protein CM15mP102_09580 [Flavobacteriales bacterium]
MKKYLTIAITLFALTIAFGQDQITWNEVGVVAKDGYANNIVQTMDNFYGNIEMPEGVSVSITAVYHSDENHKATHYLNFAGTIEGLVKLRELRSGTDYDEYTSEFSKYGETISNSHGKTFIRIPGSEDDEANFAQVWEWRVEDQAAFVEEFNKMVKVWKPEGYLSLGGILGGQSIEGESHYIYTTYNTYEEMLSFGPKTAKEQKAFEEFIKNTDAISDFKGTYSVINVQTWN